MARLQINDFEDADTLADFNVFHVNQFGLDRKVSLVETREYMNAPVLEQLDSTQAVAGTGLTGGGNLGGNFTFSLDTTFTDGRYVRRNNNLSDLTNVATARSNLGLGSMAVQNSGSVNITGGSINSTPVGATNPSTGRFTTLQTNTATISGGNINNTAIGATTPSTGKFTTVDATSVEANTVSTGNAQITGGSITGITDLAVADGGTGASTAAAARTNLGVPSTAGAGATGTWDIGITGNAGSATKLATPRTINGASFDGTSNIVTNSWGAARNFTIGNTTRSVNGSANVTWTLTDLGFGTAADRDVTGSKYDTTANRVLKVGDGGWLGVGSNGGMAEGYPQNSAENYSCIYIRGIPDNGVDAYSSSIHFAGNATAWGRLRVQNSTNKAWVQGGNSYNGTGWTAELYHSGNLNPSNYPLKSNNLSDLTSAATARSNLGLGTAAVRDVTTSQYDQTANRLLKRGDGGWLGYGLTDAIAAGYPQTSADNFTCVYRRSTADQGVRAYASTFHFAGASDTWGRLRISHSAPLAAWIQGGNSTNGTGWTAELWHSGNFNPNDYLPSNPSVSTNFIQTPGSTNIFELRTTNSADATTYLRGRHGSVNNWYIGKSAPSNDNVIFHSYIHNTQIFLGSGGITSNKNITAFSDERLKENWNTLPDNFVEQLALVKSGSYDRKDTGIRQVGVSAQSLQKVLPEAVIESEESLPEGEENKLDFEGPVLSVSYGNAALAAAVELAKTVVSLKEQVSSLSEEIKSLKEKVG